MSVRLVLEGFRPFVGKHCETTALKRALEYHGLSLSKEGIKESIRECCHSMMNPPIKNVGLSGMQKWADMVVKWPEQFKGLNLLGALMNGFIYIEIGGTGGSAFRSMYAQFLEEASSIIGKPALCEVAELIRQSGVVWSEIASGFLADSWPNLKRIIGLRIEKLDRLEKLCYTLS